MQDLYKIGHKKGYNYFTIPDYIIGNFKPIQINR